MEDILTKIGLVLLGSVLAGGGYLLKRLIEQKSVFNAIEKHQKLLSLNRELNKQKVSLSDLRNLEDAILRKREGAKTHEASIKQEIKVFVGEEEKELLTQAEMNEHAYRSFLKAKEKMTIILKALEKELDETEREALQQSQKSWEAFLEKQAEFASIQYRGGSIQPVIYYSELERLTIERAASLQSELDEILRLR